VRRRQLLLIFGLLLLGGFLCFLFACAKVAGGVVTDVRFHAISRFEKGKDAAAARFFLSSSIILRQSTPPLFISFCAPLNFRRILLIAYRSMAAFRFRRWYSL
jgi:hypothetical protein